MHKRSNSLNQQTKPTTKPPTKPTTHKTNQPENKQTVAKALELADPLITAGQTQYAKAHELVVMQPLYKKIYDLTAGIPALVADAPLVKAGYPLVAPVADPVLANLSKSKVLKQLEGHLKPKAA
jgi:hypothetical protein